MSPQWRVAPAAPQEFHERFPDLHPVTRQLLWNRGVTGPDAVPAFLAPDYYRDLHDPFLFRNMRLACERVWRAIETKEPAVIHGDYDADGITGSVVLMTTFRAVAAALSGDPSLFSSHIPHREKEGYGVRSATVELLASRGAKLLITVDCGIGCADEIALASKLGMDTIVVDHHQIPTQIPECVVLHPLVEGETYPFKKLAAVGVAFKFACGFVRFAAERGVKLEPNFEKRLLDLVAIATVTDVMPLVGENRALEKFGLIVLNRTRRPGLKALIETSGLEFGKMDTTSVGFGLGPRINAASRMDHADLAFTALMAETEEEANSAALVLDRLNRERRSATEGMMSHARASVAEAGVKKVHCVLGDGWPAGLVGLVAGKLVDETGAPTFVFGREGERIVGSGRSVPGFDVVAAMESARACLTRFGGHPQACGLTIMGEENYHAFVRQVETYAEATLAGVELAPQIAVDVEIALSQATWELVAEIKRLEPYGEGNPRPRLLLSGVTLVRADIVGKTGTHARLHVRGDAPREAIIIAFGQAEQAKSLVPGSRIDVVVEIGENEWNGTKKIELKAIALRVTTG